MAKAKRKSARARPAGPKQQQVQETATPIQVPIDSDEAIKEFKGSWSRVHKNHFQKFKSQVEQRFKKSYRHDTITDITKCFKNGRLVFVLGAGVSMDFGLPNWETLLQKLMVETIEKQRDASNVLAKLFSKIFEPSPLIAGRYLQSYFSKNEESFENAVREILYEEINRQKASPLMDQIVRFCIAPGKSPNLDSIITYNFDDLLETSIRKLSVDLPFRSIYGLGMDINPGELPIYHVHGFLPGDAALDELFLNFWNYVTLKV